ncbi:MAG: hypothetical protein K0S85_34 [Pseudomonas orientalis]|nr:hypothetical protein [Pseudomonas orientalis]
MTNSTINLSRELMTRIAHPKDCDDGYFQDIEALRAALAEPVPTAGGEPEVLAYICHGAPGNAGVMFSHLPLPEGFERKISLVDRAHVTRLQAEVERLSQALRREQNEHCTTVNARDNAEQVADEMACKIGKIFRVETGEHSNMNCPWGIAIGVLDGEYETDSDTERERAALQAELTKARELLIPEECPHMIVFDDADRETLMFAGEGARTAALNTWTQISRSWNAHLFVRVERNSRDDRYPSAHQSAPAARDGE